MRDSLQIESIFSMSLTDSAPSLKSSKKIDMSKYPLKSIKKLNTKNMSLLNTNASCELCGAANYLLRCSRCKSVHYCSKSHQKQDWKRHKTSCEKNLDLLNNKEKCDQNSSTSLEGCSKNANLHSKTGGLNLVGEVREEKSSTEKAIKSAKTAMPFTGENIVHPKKSNFDDFPESSHPPFLHKNPDNVLDEMCRNVIKDMDSYGVCVVDNFFGEERGKSALSEVVDMYTKGLFTDGQLVSTKGQKDLKTIRGDQITWIDGREHYCKYLGKLIAQVDALIIRANKMENNGKLGDYNINDRTKAMVACYPGSGTHYVKHVDNPNKDGRCITAIYYLNQDWDFKRSGGLLRIFPEGWRGDRVADIEPIFDRLLFFWSDRRNPHEVQPAFETRYAITLWYFDAVERAEACRRFEKERNNGIGPLLST